MTGTAPERGVDIRLPPAYRLVSLDSVGSTNEEAIRLAEAGAEDGTLVWAREQSKGRGRMGRSFTSPRGNLYLSLVLRPDCDIATAAQLSFVAALAIGDGIGSVAPAMLEITYKWPNDVLLNERKVSGILLETKSAPRGGIDWLVLGVGINVASFPEDTEFPATSLHFEGTPKSVSEVDLLQAFSRHLLTWINRWLEDGFAPVRKTWLSHAQGKGEIIQVRLPKETLSGTFVDIDEGGVLLLDVPGAGQRRIAAGDVFFLK
jgi:BirA family transcriptional regulator, biotin operon repressor / biotin---[acetyl-CoA-carboxylase] ligase